MEYRRFMRIVDTVFAFIWSATAICPIIYVWTFAEATDHPIESICVGIYTLLISALAIVFEWIIWRMIEWAAKGIEDENEK